MKIALRTSGGRGEYELAGRQGDHHAANLQGKDILYEITPEVTIPGHSQTTSQGNKPRIRLRRTAATHFYRVASALLLLPDPIRELGRTDGHAELLRDGCFSICSIQVDVADVDADSVTLRPTALVLKNAAGKILRLGFAERLAQVMAVWRHAHNINGALADLLQEHERAVMRHHDNHSSILRSKQNIKRHLNTDGDVLNDVLKYLNLVHDVGADLPEDESEDIDAEIGEDEDITDIQARRRQIRHWRKQAARGSDGRRFRGRVIQAYDARCVFSGLRLPQTSATLHPGVDAAHILPWAQYEITSIRNGICLSKLCHWAFDAGVLRLECEGNTNNYSLSVPQEVQVAAEQEGLDIDYFLRLEGTIPLDRMPDNRGDWPSPRFLEELNARMFF